jgi:hypothetical protein
MTTEKLTNKRIEQLKETWVKNVMQVQNISRVDAELLYNKIQPYRLNK